MQSVLIDTNIVIDFIRQNFSPNTIFAKLMQNEHVLKIALITHTELYAGKSAWENEFKRRDLDQVIGALETLEFNVETSLIAGQLVAQHNPNIADAIIAATAISNKLPLATLNSKDFKNIPGLKLFELK